MDVPESKTLDTMPFRSVPHLKVALKAQALELQCPLPAACSGE